MLIFWPLKWHVFFFFLDISTRMSFGQIWCNIFETFQCLLLSNLLFSSVKSILPVSICSNLGGVLTSPFVSSPDFQWITDLYRCASATSLLSRATTPVWLSSHPDCWESQHRVVLKTQALESGYHLLAFWTRVSDIFSVSQFSYLKNGGNNHIFT